MRTTMIQTKTEYTSDNRFGQNESRPMIMNQTQCDFSKTPLEDKDMLKIIDDVNCSESQLGVIEILINEHQKELGGSNSCADLSNN